MEQQDETLQRIRESFRLYCRGDQTEARHQLAALWDELKSDGYAYQRCVLAHFIADTQHNRDDELAWDLEALQIADAAIEGGTDPTVAAVEKFLPSLHMNLADAFRKRGDFPKARHHVELGMESGGSLGVDAYGQRIRAELLRIEAQIAENDSGPPVVFDFD